MKHKTFKKRMGLTALALSVAVLSGLLAACGTGDTQASETPSTGVEESEEPSAPASEDVLGRVTAVGTDGTISLEYYEAAGTVEDYAALDISTLTATGESGNLTPDSDAAYYTVSGGALVAATADDVTTGSIIAVTTGEDGSQQIIVLGTAEANGVDADAVVAEVTAVAEDGTLTLSTYQLTEAAAGYTIADYASVEMSNYEDSGVSQDYTIADGTTVQIAENETLRDGQVSDIAVGDMLVLYANADGSEGVVVYPAASSQAAE